MPLLGQIKYKHASSCLHSIDQRNYTLKPNVCCSLYICIGTQKYLIDFDKNLGNCF